MRGLSHQTNHGSCCLHCQTAAIANENVSDVTIDCIKHVTQAEIMFTDEVKFYQR